jgi:cytochrome c oxidase assembly protein subunit 15
MTPTPHPATPVWLRRYAKAVAASTLFLIFAGAMVTSTGSGLAVPDWPLSYGRLMPRMIGGIFYEHGHRMFAATVGLLTVIQAIWLQLREPKRFVRVLGWCAVGAVIAQGVLGGVTVLLLLPKATSIGHAALAEVYLCLNMSIAFFTSRAFLRMRDREPGTSPVAQLPVAETSGLVAVVYLQILAGALMRHLGAGLAIPDFPLAFGRIIPPITTAAIAANFAHRLGAVVVTAVMVVTVVKAIRIADPVLRRLSALLLVIVSLQVFLGGLVVWAGAHNLRYYHSLEGELAIRNATVTSLHVLTGASTLVVSLLLALAVRTLAVPAGARRTTDRERFAGSEVTA